MIGNLLTYTNKASIKPETVLITALEREITYRHYLHSDNFYTSLTDFLNAYEVTNGATPDNLNEYYTVGAMPEYILGAGVYNNSLEEVENVVNKIYTLIYKKSKEDVKKILKYNDSLVLSQVIHLLSSNYSVSEVKEFLSDKENLLTPASIRAINFAFDSSSFEELYTKVEFSLPYTKAIALSIGEYVFGYIPQKYIQTTLQNLYNRNYRAVVDTAIRYLDDRIRYIGESSRITNDTKILIANFDFINFNNDREYGKEVYCFPNIAFVGHYIATKIYESMFCYEYNDALLDAISCREYDGFFGMLQCDCFFNNQKMYDNCDTLYDLTFKLDNPESIEDLRKYIEVVNNVMTDINNDKTLGYLPNVYTSLEVYDNPLELMEKYSLTEFNDEIFDGIRNIEKVK